MKTISALQRALRLLAFLAVALGVSQAQSVTTSGCLSIPTEDDNPCPVSYNLSITTDGTSIYTYALAGGDDIDTNFDVEIDLSVFGHGVSDSTSGDQEVDLEDSLPPNATGIYEATAYIQACGGFTGEAEGPGQGFSGCASGSFGVRMTATVPNVTTVSPSSITLGTSGTLTLSGNNFIDTFGGTPTLVSNSGGLTLTSISNTQATVSYNAVGMSAGQFTVGLIGLFGQGTQQTFTVTDPTPTISSVVPSTWNAGATTIITINGNGFGTAPTLSINGPGVTDYSISSLSDTQIIAYVNISPSSPGGTATVQVQSNGYGGSGFLGQPGQPSTVSNSNARIQPEKGVPQITFNGANVSSGSTQNVIVGQQIALAASTINLPAGLSVQSQAWSFSNSAAATGGFVNTAGTGSPSSSGGGKEASLPPLTQSSLTFYWKKLNDSTETVTYSYTLSNGQSSAETVNFNVAGPTGNLVLTANMPTDGSGVQVLSAASGTKLGTTGTVVTGGQVGISFTSNAVLPSGYNQSVTWVQLVTNQIQYLNSKGPFAIPPSPQTGIDNTYPYTNVSSTSTYDSPAIGLPSTYGEGWETFTATMYLMWDPGLPSGCSPARTVQNPDGTFAQTASTCTSIPIPLSSITWHWSGCAINSLANQSNGTIWLRSTTNGCPVETLGTAQSAGFPSWTSAIQNN